MNKKYVIGGVIVACAGIAGWFGVRAVETQTEKAVAEALAVVPAEAREIKYSLLGNTLTLKGVTYELSDEGFARKGSIDSVEVKGFNRKYVFTKSDAAYNPESLPVVAESIAASGIDDTVTLGETTVEQKAGSVRLTGWYQRLGTLLSLHREHRGEAPFFEELYRCRIDGMEASNVSIKLSEKTMSPVSLSVERIALVEGLRAPEAGEKTSPVSLGFFGLRGFGKDVSGSLDTLEIRDIRMPEPELVAEFLKVSKKIDAVSEDDLFGDVGEQIFTEMDRIIGEAYQDHMPVGRIFMEGGSLNFQDTPEEAPAVFEGGSPSVQDAPEEKGAEPAVFSVTMKSFDYRLSMTEPGASRYVTDLSGLKMTFPKTMEEADIISRYAPDGLTLNASSDSLVSREACSGKVRYEVEGLGSLEGDMALQGDLRGLVNAITSDDRAGLNEFMTSMRLKNVNVTYRDSGLLPMSVEIAARWGDSTAERELAELSMLLGKMAKEKERPVRELGEALLVMFEKPGVMRMVIAPAQPMNFMEALTLASLNPDELPLSFSAEPGNKALRDYLPKQ